MAHDISIYGHCSQPRREHPVLEVLPLQDASSPDAERTHARLCVPCLPVQGMQWYG